MSGLAPVRRVLLRDEAYEHLRRAIVTGELKPGEQLREHDLAAELGLSRAPVRQALTRLTAEGLVESKPQSFTRVAPLESDDVRDALQLTRALHEFAVRSARLTPEHLTRMRAANAKFAAAIEAREVDAAIEADDEFHDVPVEACGNRAVAETLDRYTPLLRRLERARFSSLPAHRSIRRHEQLIDACAAGDTGEAVRITGRIWAELGDLLDAGKES
ncbi:GntR family transcriptional regulator [Amycolatopsis magusensis]|uniref:DNA-binding GntR family transcriptional regulator n=1 Tax=Amycolatopsis magusensis TaxID=882444 RepID=A0ABS4PSE2_9PSEU|nr:GntR family transcriptional regulator [Amycolatopsis magusensis]MBP2182347.1 DNA-binding GntR family transcriptional regulator [Amycolatopsis magusensis]MDI5976348.1 GntR family transcriptional regulator [Amycolatopsis magusensis]